MTARPLKLEDFSDHVGASFAFVTDTAGVPDLVLTEAGPLPLHGRTDLPRPPFSLVFDLPGALLLPQGVYHLRHPELGEIEMFLVPMAQDASAVRYCATFN
jgi:hypothetical protein